MTDNDKTNPTVIGIGGMEATLVGVFNIQGTDIWGEVYSLHFSEKVFIRVEDLKNDCEVDIFDHTTWSEEYPSYTEEDLWLEEEGGQLYLRCGTSGFLLELTPVE